MAHWAAHPRLLHNPARTGSAWVALFRDAIDRNGKPVGTDSSSVYATGTLAWQGKAANACDAALQHTAEIALFGGQDLPFYGWHYPPFSRPLPTGGDRSHLALRDHHSCACLERLLVTRSIAGLLHVPFGMLAVIALDITVIRRAVLEFNASHHRDDLATA